MRAALAGGSAPDSPVTSSTASPWSAGSTSHRVTVPLRTSHTSVMPCGAISSMPIRPWTTSACSTPSRASAPAMSGARSASATPTTWRRTPAGLASGPSRFSTDGTASSRRTGPACFMAGWKVGANRNVRHASRSTRAAAAASSVMGTPSASSTSAEPHFEVKERLPCFATDAPAPAATNAAAVEMLKVETVPPPVPQVSTRWGPSATTRTMASRNARAAPATSSGVSPFTRSPMSSAPICAGVASPRITAANTSVVWRSESDWRLARAAMAWASGEVGMGIRGLPKLSRKIAFCQIPQRVAWLDRASLSAYLSPVTSRPYLAVVHYDGAQFVGWQRQRDGRTVQAEFEAVLARLMGRRTTATGAGRTDTGVHALGQGVGFLAGERWAADADGLRRALNALLPRDVWVERVHPMRAGFHARKSAVARRYRYLIGTDDTADSPFRRPYEWAFARPLDPLLLARAAELLPGEHDFRGLAATAGGREGEGGGRDAERHHRSRVALAQWAPRTDGAGVTFTIEADRFLHRMVRFLVGAMVDIALGRRPLEDLPRLLVATDNQAASPPAPPQGLYLVAVHYPAHLYAEARSEERR